MKMEEVHEAQEKHVFFFQNLVLGFMLVLFGLHCFFFENGS